MARTDGARAAREGLRRSRRLDQPLVSESPYIAYTQFVGVTQHGLYTAGQMTMLKRAISA